MFLIYIEIGEYLNKIVLHEAETSYTFLYIENVFK